jgi:hypothetical protein
VAKLVVDIFEDGDRAPVVRHAFYGKSKQAARKIMRAHMKTDRFLRGCELKGKFSSIVCRTTKKWG